MSTHSVPFTLIKNIFPHPNPVVERLEIIQVYEYNVIARKGQYKVGQGVFYIPIDSLLPSDLESQLFPEGSKVKLSKSRVKQIKLQGFYSQGLLISEEDVTQLLKARNAEILGQFMSEFDYASTLGITKFAPPEPEYKPKTSNVQKLIRPKAHPLLHKYNGIEHFKRYSYLINENDDMVVIQEKLHGGNGKIGLLPSIADTFWKKIKKFFGMLPSHEIRYASNNVELTFKSSKDNWYGDDVWAKALKNAGVYQKIKPNEVIYGEVIGEGLQKNYNYGHTEPFFVVFDIKRFSEDLLTWTWLDPEEVESVCKERNLVMVPVLYTGPLKDVELDKLVSGDSVYCSKQKIREGVVIKKRHKYFDPNFSAQKAALKFINPEYLSKEQTDFQ